MIAEIVGLILEVLIEYALYLGKNRLFIFIGGALFFSLGIAFLLYSNGG